MAFEWKDLEGKTIIKAETGWQEGRAIKLDFSDETSVVIRVEYLFDVADLKIESPSKDSSFFE